MCLKSLNIIKYLIISGTRNWNGIKFGAGFFSGLLSVVFKWVYPKKNCWVFLSMYPGFWTVMLDVDILFYVGKLNLLQLLAYFQIYYVLLRRQLLCVIKCGGENLCEIPPFMLAVILSYLYY